MYFTPFFSVSITDFEQVNVSGVISSRKWSISIAQKNEAFH